MRKNSTQNKLVFKSVTVFFAVLFSVFGLGASSESLIDDVTAMITNAKKTPHTIFVIDTSESMNTFAYSDYLDTCKDGESNVNKAIILCDNAYKQCRNVEYNASCAVDLGCASVQTRCYELRQKLAELHSFCNQVGQVYPEPSRTAPATAGEMKKFVGPWRPTKTDYTQDLCFYDWSSDSDGNVMEGTTSGHWSNTTGDITDRRDWDCITDGKDTMSNGASFAATGGLSGNWLNWKYATSLDAVKIILANVHSFSYPPRSRGKNECYGTKYYPKGADGSKVCYLDFDTDFTGMASRKDMLEAMKTEISSGWYSEYMINPDAEGCSEDSTAEKCKIFTEDICSGFTANFETQFSTFPEDSSDAGDDPAPSRYHHKTPAAGECDKCMRWNDSAKKFFEVECTVFDGTTIDSDSELKNDLCSLSATLDAKTCCKTFECTNPKCRDNDVCCKDNASAFPNNSVEGYDTCRPDGGDYSCTLGFYSEYDQDANHCCASVKCKDGEEGTSQNVADDECDECASGYPIGEDSVSVNSDYVEIIGAPNCGQGNKYQSEIPLKVKLKSISNLDKLVVGNVTISVYAACNPEIENGPHGDLVSLGSYTCNAETCAAGVTVASATLTGCEDKGYSLKAYATLDRAGCKFSAATVNIELNYELEKYVCGSDKMQPILNPAESYYEIYRMETSGETGKIVNEYECKTAFYHRQSLVIDGTKCPSAALAPGLINEDSGYTTSVEYCDEETVEKETVAVDQWGFTTKVACSWQCRDAVTYDDPWKCASFFYMMNETKYNGLDSSSVESHCGAAKDNPAAQCSGSGCFTGATELEACCKAIAAQQSIFTHLEPQEGVRLNDGSGKDTKCAVSGYQFGTASNGRTTTTSGYMAELVTGHIKEAGTGSYLLSPYMVGDNYFSPYDGWYENDCLYKKGSQLVNNTFISAFKTADGAVRYPACIYDLMYNWEGEDCNSCETGCCAIDLSQDDNGCDYPQFWMKVPMSDGGRHIFGAKDFSSEGSLEEFQGKIKSLTAVGGATLGETLYDVWRYLGGMYALYDPKHTYSSDPDSTNTPYESPFENQDATCFTNEAVIISGGQPQFDHNTEIKKYGVTTCGDSVPCVDSTGESITSETPYYVKEWYQTSILKVANFAKNTSFWGKTETCRKTDDLTKNILGYDADTACKDDSPMNSGNNKAVINRVHTIAIGEWVLSQYYSLFNTSHDSFLDKSLLRDVANDSDESKKGQYYGLTTDNVGEGDSNGNFNSLTDLFTSMMTKPQPTDVVSGRPHWTSSLVQPFDVEEKYRGPEAYTAGAIPIDGSVSRFWFGNLKKYMLDDDSQGCSITDDKSATCGAWTKQKFESAIDCFAKKTDEAPSTDDVDDRFGCGDAVNGVTTCSDNASKGSVAQFQTLMVGGAAFRLEEKIKNYECGSLPCYVGSPRNIYYDDGTEMHGPNVNITTDNAAVEKFMGTSVEADPAAPIELGKIFDYMAGHDAFKEGDARKAIRYSDGEPLLVDDPINIDFNKSSKIAIRPLLLGAIIHSKPVAVYYGDSSTTRIYVGANDGMLHAFDEGGNEVYAYIPSNAAASIRNFGGTDKGGVFFNATVDGPITMFHIDQSHDGIINNGEKAYLIFGYRRGATGYTVIDISDKDRPVFVQNINKDGGLSFGKAVIFRKCSGVCSYANQLDYYLAVPGGYDDCNDPASDLTSDLAYKQCAMVSNLKGNRFSIYKFNGSKFVKVRTYGPDTTGTGNAGTDRFAAGDRAWLQTSFASTPFVVNTSGKAAVNTEFIYFSDLSGTVFRIDVRGDDDDASEDGKWTAKVVFSQRSSASVNDESNVFARSYVASNFFPPLERYNPGRNENIIPISLISGDAANPKHVEQADIFVFYDKKNEDVTDFSYHSGSFNDSTEGDGNGTLFTNLRGWNIPFAAPKTDKAGEKGITEPIITYDVYGSKTGNAKNGYSIAWNTYIPKKVTQCRSFGTSNNYERLVPDGSQALKTADGNVGANGTRGEWDPAKCSTVSSDISIATGVGVVATDKGYDLTFGAGADIFRKREINVQTNSTHIIKWYELY